MKFDPNTDEHLEYVLKRAYRYAIGDLGVGTDEISNDLCDALCNLIGADTFSDWNEKLEF